MCFRYGFPSKKILPQKSGKHNIVKMEKINKQKCPFVVTVTLLALQPPACSCPTQSPWLRLTPAPLSARARPNSASAKHFKGIHPTVGTYSCSLHLKPRACPGPPLLRAGGLGPAVQGRGVLAPGATARAHLLSTSGSGPQKPLQRL